MLPTHIGRYEIKAEIGRGGMATVYQAYDPRVKRAVAIKVLPPQFLHDPTFRARFEREAETIASLEHPAIVPVYDFGDEAGLPYLVMRFMPGGTLSDHLKQGPLTIPEAARILSRLAPALDDAHDRGIIHRDLKPANILFDLHSDAFLTDFGIAHVAEATMVLTGDAIVGTPAYMSPEQARGDAELDGRSDIYALGAILFEMLSGKQPYQATTPMGVLLKHISEPVPRLLEIKADLPPGCEEVITRAMAKERDQRFATAGELASALQAISSKPTPQPEAGPLVRAAGSSRSVEAQSSFSNPVGTGASGSSPSPQLPGGKSAANRPAREKRPGLPPWIWLLGGLVALLGLCGLAGLFLAGSRWLARPQTGVIVSPPVISSPPVIEFTPGPTPDATPIEKPALPVFKDDFSDPSSGWARLDDAGGKLDYDSGGYRILVDRPHMSYWSTAGLEFQDVTIEVEAEKIGGADDNYFGVICRYQDEQNFYLFWISSDGYFGIEKYKQGKFETIHEQAWGYNDAIHQGKTTNRLRADCLDDTLTLYANGSRLAEVTDADFTSGDVGLLATAADIAGTNILFDNFVAQKP